MDKKEKMVQEIQADIQKNKVIVFMKGNKLMPLCGFSAKVVHILNLSNVEFETRNVLEDDLLRETIKEFSSWPTLPQLYVNGKFIGGCDIVLDLYEKGDLLEILKT